MVAAAADLARETVAPDEAAVAAAFVAFLTSASVARHPAGVLRRFNQARASGFVDAEFQVPDVLPDDLRVGLFARPGTYRAVVRFGNAVSASDREKDVRGMAISLLDVPGPNLTPGATTQDFVLNSHPVMMVPGTREFLELLQANEAGGVRRALYFLSHPRALQVAIASRQQPASHLDIPYWSTTPSLFGEGRAVKYVVRPAARHVAARPSPLTDTYLHDALAAHLSRADATFDFMLQFQTDSRRMPIEDASVEWREAESPYLRVARLRIPRQEVDAPGREAAGERYAFNPWHGLPAHRPLGSLNRARRDIYTAMARLREERLVGLGQPAG